MSTLTLDPLPDDLCASDGPIAPRGPPLYLYHHLTPRPHDVKSPLLAIGRASLPQPPSLLSRPQYKDEHGEPLLLTGLAVMRQFMRLRGASSYRCD